MESRGSRVGDRVAPIREARSPRVRPGHRPRSRRIRRRGASGTRSGGDSSCSPGGQCRAQRCKLVPDPDRGSPRETLRDQVQSRAARTRLFENTSLCPVPRWWDGPPFRRPSIVIGIIL
jgi:hypothetical protein